MRPRVAVADLPKWGTLFPSIRVQINEFGTNNGAEFGGCTLGATGLEDFLLLHELHKVHDFNGCFDPQHDLQLIAEAKRGFIEALPQQNCLLSVCT